MLDLQVVSDTPNSAGPLPTWRWSAVASRYRVKLDDPDMSRNATETTSTVFTPPHPLVDGTHVLYVAASVAQGAWTAASTFAVTVDTIPPNQPGAPVASCGSVSAKASVTFAWADPGDTSPGRVVFYNLQVGTTAGGSDVYADRVTGLAKAVNGSDGATLYARVQAVDEAGNVSTWSAGSASVLLDLSPPVPGSAVTVSGVTSSAAGLTWTQATDNLTAASLLTYQPYVSQSGGLATPAAVANGASPFGTSLTGGANHVMITGLSDATTYWFYLVASDAAGNQALYAPATATTAQIAPSVFVDSGSQLGLNSAVGVFAYTSQLTAFNNKLYAAWAELTNWVSVYNGNDLAPSWTHTGKTVTFGLDRCATAAPFCFANAPYLLAFGGKLYAAWEEAYSGTGKYQIRVAVYNGNDAAPDWTMVDGNAVAGLNFQSAQNAYDPSLGVIGGRLLVAWVETSATGANVTRAAAYNGNDAAPAWVSVDGGGASGLNFDGTKSSSGTQMVAYSNVLYLAWKEGLVGRIAAFNGNFSAPAWSFVDGAGVSGIGFMNLSLQVFGGKLYAAGTDFSVTPFRNRVAVYNGVDLAPTWTSVDGDKGLNYASAFAAGSVAIAALNGSLYGIWTESNGTANQVRMAQYNGTDAAPVWRLVDGNGLNGMNLNPAKNAYAPGLAALGTKIYATWLETNSANVQEVRVAVGR